MSVTNDAESFIRKLNLIVLISINLLNLHQVY